MIPPGAGYRALVSDGAGVMVAGVPETISRSRLSLLSVTYTSPSGSRETFSATVRRADVAGPPSPELPLAPEELPTTV